MRKFAHEQANTFEEAKELLQNSKNGAAIAGGTDLLGVMKTAILEKSPDVVVNLKTIKKTPPTVNSDGSITIGATVSLTEISEDEKLPKGLSKAAASIATPLLRNTGTIGGCNRSLS